MKVFYLKGWVPVEDTETDTVPLCPFGFRVYAISIDHYSQEEAGRRHNGGYLRAYRRHG